MVNESELMECWPQSLALAIQEFENWATVSWKTLLGLGVNFLLKSYLKFLRCWRHFVLSLSFCVGREAATDEVHLWLRRHWWKPRAHAWHLGARGRATRRRPVDDKAWRPRGWRRWLWRPTASLIPVQQFKERAVADVSLSAAAPALLPSKSSIGIITTEKQSVTERSIMRL